MEIKAFIFDIDAVIVQLDFLTLIKEIISQSTCYKTNSTMKMRYIPIEESSSSFSRLYNDE